MTTAAIYLRVSTRHQADEGFSLDDQRATLTATATNQTRLYRVFDGFAQQLMATPVGA